MHVLPTRAVRPVVAVIVAALVAACGSGSGASSSSGSGTGTTGTTPSGSGATAATGVCPTTAAPASLPGWTATAKAGGVVPQLISSQLVCGQNRLLFGFTTVQTSNGQQTVVSAGSPDRTATVAFYDLAKDPAKAVSTTQATFLWAIEGTTGIYVANVTFPTAGDWGAEFTTADKGGAPETIRVRFQVQAEGVVPGIGDTVPSVKTPTAADVGGDLKQISTDPSPNARFYELSEDQAVAQHKPFVLVFATPAFCTSQICGPTLDKVKALATTYPDLTFINVEPYKMAFSNGRLQPVLDSNGQLQTNAASDAFKILSEPWIFVVDGQGRVTGSFETLAGQDEMQAAIAAATKK